MMRHLVAAEWYKLRKNQVFLQMLWFVAAMAVIFPLFIYWSVPKEGGYQAGITVMKLYANSLALNDFLIKVELGILAGFFICSDYTSGVLKRMAASGASRMETYVSKLLVFTIGIAILACALPLLALAAGLAMDGIGLLSGFGQADEGTASLYLLRTLAFTFLFSAAFASLAALIAVVLPESGKAIALSLLVFLFADQVISALANNVSWLENIYDYSLFKLFRVALEGSVPTRELALAIGLPLASIAVFAAWGAHHFRRQEVK